METTNLDSLQDIDPMQKIDTLYNSGKTFLEKHTESIVDDEAEQVVNDEAEQVVNDEEENTKVDKDYEINADENIKKMKKSK